MTYKGFFGLFFVQLIILTLLKLWFFQVQLFGNSGVQQMVFWLVVGIVSAATVRRLGVINFAEAFFVIAVWAVGDAFIDLILTSKYTGLSLFSNFSYWTGFVIMAIVVILSHKKRHITVRHELQAKAHAAAHALAHPNEHKH